MDILTQLYERYRNGDNAAFDELVLSCRDGLIYFINGYVKDIHTAEDISEDVFVALLLHPKRFSVESSVKTYIYTIGRNKAIDHLRKHRRTQVDENAGVFTADCEDIEARVLTAERDRMLHECIKTLKPEYAEILHLVYFEGMDLKQAAKVMKKSYKQVENLSFRAKQSLKKKLLKEGVTYEIG